MEPSGTKSRSLQGDVNPLLLLLSPGHLFQHSNPTICWWEYLVHHEFNKLPFPLRIIFQTM